MKAGFSSLFLPLTVLLLSLLACAVCAAAELHLKSDTLVRFFERDTSGQQDVFVAPAYEYLQLDMGQLSEKGLSFHFYGWGRADAGDGDFFEDDTAGEILYGYLQYRHPGSNAELRLGRQYVFAGVADESVDGLRLASDLTPYFAVSAYGGYPVALDATQGRSGDSIYGGRLSHHLKSFYDIGVSYKSVDNDSDLAEERLGIDVFLGLPGGVDLNGFSARNLDTEGWAEHSYELRFALAEILFRPFYQQFQYEDYFNTGAKSANPFRFLAGTGEELTLYGVEGTWSATEQWELGIKVKSHDYDLRGDSSEFYSGLLTWHAENRSQVGGELGYMDGDAAENTYLLARAFFYCEGLGQKLPLAFLTGDVVYVDYDRQIDSSGEDSSLFVSLGLGSRFFNDALELKLSGDYSVDPFFDEDLRGLVVGSLAFDR